MLRKTLSRMSGRPELVILAVMIMVVMMLIIPLPTYLVDFLIGLNLIVSLLIFTGSFYLNRILDFSTFPSVLLITTIFRLAISISTTRLILTDADAGEIISSFGSFVIADNLVVGFVVFFIVTIVQFIVITKGSERIAEVAARFSLDAMPGKQMSIDADLRAGVIDEKEVKKRRKDLEAESQLYGALDGAMKFIKGDAIAGIVIIFVNFLGGISVGVFQHGMALTEALSVFTMLTIGDALVGQIPALLISISGGLIVTRVNNSENNNLGSKILQDMFSNKFILIITAILSVGLGLLPGFPMPVFVFLSLILLCVFFRHQIKERIGKADATVEPHDQPELSQKPVMIDGEYIAETIPLIITVWEGHEQYLTSNNFKSLLKRNFFIEYGIRIPEIVLNYSETIEREKIIVAINEITVASYDIIPGMNKVLMRGDELQLIDDSVICVTSAQGSIYWIPEDRSDLAYKLGFYSRNALEEFYNCISTLLVHNINEFFGIQETKLLLDDLEHKYPELLKECYRNNTVQRITEVFQRLLQERISVRNMRLILEALVQWAPKEKDPIMLVEHVRSVLSRYISSRFSIDGKIKTLVMSNDMETTIRSGLRQTNTGSFINLPPNHIEDIMRSIDAALKLNGIGSRDIIIMVSLDIRRFVKRLIENTFPEIEVLSFSEITPDIDIDVIGALEMGNGVNDEV